MDRGMVSDQMCMYLRGGSHGGGHVRQGSRRGDILEGDIVEGGDYSRMRKVMAVLMSKAVVPRFP